MIPVRAYCIYSFSCRKCDVKHHSRRSCSAAANFRGNISKDRLSPNTHIELPVESILNLRKICLKQPFERNLIDNPSGEKDFEGWIINADGGDGFNVEHPPRGLTVVLKEVIPTAFSTSYGYCYKYCCIDLWQEGIDSEFLDTFCPPITISDCINCVWQCRAIYKLRVLLKPDKRLRYKTKQFPSFTWSYTFENSDAQWKHVEHTFSEYPTGLRYVIFGHGGKDLMYWAGYYGPKMANSSVVVHFGDGHKRR